MRHASKKKFQSFNPANAVIIGIDPGAVSGYSIYCGGRTPHEYGLASTAVDRQSVITKAALLARENEMRSAIPVVIGAEKWAPGFKSHDATVGTGASWGRWEHVIELEGLKRNVLRVEVGEWRKAILGPDPKMKRDQLKQLALTSAIARGLLPSTETSHDVAEAVLIGLYFVYAAETQELIESIPRRRT